MKRLLRPCVLLLCVAGLFPAARGQSTSGETGTGSGAPQPQSPSNVPTGQTPPSPTAPKTPPGNAAVSPNGNDIWQENFLTGNWGGFRDEMKNHGITLSPVYTGEVFGNPSGGVHQGVVTDGLLETALDIDFDPLTGGAVKDLTFHVNALYIYGSNLSTQDTGDFSTTSNIAAYNTLRLQEIWVQKLFWEKKLSLKVGNIAVDTEFFQSNSASLFINSTFGSFTVFANNVTNPPVYPLASPGVRLQYLPSADFYVMAGVFGQDDGGNQSRNNANGTRFALNSGSGALVMSEVGFLLNQAPKETGLQGTYRVGSFVDTGDHTTFQSQAAFANGTGPRQNAGTNFGVYGVMDQQLFARDKEIVSLFVRSGGAPSETNFVDYYVDAGFNFTGFVPGRDSDVGGLAVARSHVSDDYSDAQVAQGQPALTAETELEATYKAQLAPWWSIQPDVQYIVTPSGVEGSPNALVLGVRTTVSF